MYRLWIPQRCISLLALKNTGLQFNQQGRVNQVYTINANSCGFYVCLSTCLPFIQPFYPRKWTMSVCYLHVIDHLIAKILKINLILEIYIYIYIWIDQIPRNHRWLPMVDGRWLMANWRWLVANNRWLKIAWGAKMWKKSLLLWSPIQTVTSQGWISVSSNPGGRRSPRCPWKWADVDIWF